jgi:signal transduction histidine kinase
VRDDGEGLPEGAVREGVGLANTRARLEALYGAAQRLEIANQPEGGTIVTIEVPWHPTTAGTASEERQ